MTVSEAEAVKGCNHDLSLALNQYSNDEKINLDLNSENKLFQNEKSSIDNISCEVVIENDEDEDLSQDYAIKDDSISVPQRKQPKKKKSKPKSKKKNTFETKIKTKKLPSKNSNSFESNKRKRKEKKPKKNNTDYFADKEYSG